jgi:hypothetical protein
MRLLIFLTKKTPWLQNQIRLLASYGLKNRISHAIQKSSKKIENHVPSILIKRVDEGGFQNASDNQHLICIIEKQIANYENRT